MIGLDQTISIVTAAKVEVRGVLTADWTNATLAEAKAHVYYEKTYLGNDTGPGVTYHEQLIALMKPAELEAGFTRIRWEGTDYSMIGDPEVRYRHGRPMFQAVKMGA